MNILYVSNACSTKEYSRLFDGMKISVNHQSQKFNRLFAEGLAKNGHNVTLLSSRPVSPTLHPKKWYNKKCEEVNGVKYTYLSFFNYRYVRQALIYLNLRKEVKNFIKRNPDGIIICDILNYSLLSALLSVNRKNVKLIGVVTDLPEILAGGTINERIKKHNEMIANCDGLVLLAEPMTDRINPYNKPYVIMEGFCDIKMSEVENNLDNKYASKVVMYAGLLHKKYGIENLTKAFINANIQNSELHIYGTGDYEEELTQIAKDHSNVKFFGTKDNSYIVKEQLKATLLVNPRPTNEEFVKYSFPSKNMEYTASGTPMLTTNLPSMPDEYKEYCFVSDGYDVPNLEKALKDILSMSKEALYNKGCKAKEWVLNNKSNVMQSNRVTEFIKSIK